MKKFSSDLNFKDAGLALSRTLLIRNIPQHLSTQNLMRKHLAEAYPDLTVTDVSMAYDVAELTEKSEELRDARDSRMLGERLELEQEGESLMMYPRACSRFSGLFCRCCSEKVSLTVLKYFLCW